MWDRGLTAIQFVICVLSCYGGLHVNDQRWQLLLFAIASSFLFALLVNFLSAFREWLTLGRLRRFFGRELIMGDKEKAYTLIYPEFAPHADVLGILKNAGMTMKYEKGGGRFSELPIEVVVRESAAKHDIQALGDIARLLDGTQAKPTLCSDVDFENPPGNEMAHSFISVGLTSNDIPRIYEQHAGERALFHVDRGERAGTGSITIWNGSTFTSTQDVDHGIIVRYSPDRATWPDRRWFIVGG